jgi:hypothetical protein
MDADVFSRCISLKMFGSELEVFGAEDLIAMKIFAGGPRDLADVGGILEVSGDRLNIPLLKKLTRRYGSQEFKILASLLKKYVKPA